MLARAADVDRPALAGKVLRCLRFLGRMPVRSPGVVRHTA